MVDPQKYFPCVSYGREKVQNALANEWFREIIEYG